MPAVIMINDKKKKFYFILVPQKADQGWKLSEMKCLNQSQARLFLCSKGYTEISL
jgi:hypothetical protein